MADRQTVVNYAYALLLEDDLRCIAENASQTRPLSAGDVTAVWPDVTD